LELTPFNRQKILAPSADSMKDTNRTHQFPWWAYLFEDNTDELTLKVEQLISCQLSCTPRKPLKKMMRTGKGNALVGIAIDATWCMLLIVKW
jgi:hypothetical protein